MGHITFEHDGRITSKTPKQWLPVAAEIGVYARDFSGRSDIAANVGPNIGGKFSTACWTPLLADLDVNTDTCLPGYTPDRVNFSDPVFQLGAMPFVGAVTHEAAHARWTCWTPRDLGLRTKADKEVWTQALVEVVIALEESRIETLAAAKQPDKRDALAQCALSIVLKDFKVNNTLFGASISLALTVGRYALLSRDEIDRFRDLIEPYLPMGLMSRLEALIREYHRLPVKLAMDKAGPGDDYFAQMHDIASRWLVAIRETAAAVAEARKAESEARKAAEEAAAEAEPVEEDEDTPETDMEGPEDGSSVSGSGGAGAGEGEGSEGGAGAPETTPDASDEPAEDEETGEGAEGSEEPAEGTEADTEADTSGAEIEGEGSDLGEDPSDEGDGADSDEDAEGASDEPERDMGQPQPDLSSGIPGEDATGGRSVVVIVFEAPEPDAAPADAPEAEDAPEDEAPDLGDALRGEAGKAAMERENEALEEREKQVAERMMQDKAEDAARRSESKELMEKRHVTGTGQSGFGEYEDRSRGEARKPEPGERIAATRLAKTLERITFHDRTVVKRDRVVPGGKLRPRAAVAQAADRARGGHAQIPVWRAKERHHSPETPVKVAIATDVSGSMSGNEIPSAVLTYVLSNAVAGIDGEVATATFGNRGFLVNRAHERAETVQSWEANGSFEAFREAALLLDNELNLLDGNGARILVVFTDAHFVRPDHKEYAGTFMRLCKQRNVAVIWCSYDETPCQNFGHGTILRLTGSPADIANTLGEAIVQEVSKVESRRSA